MAAIPSRGMDAAAWGWPARAGSRKPPRLCWGV